MISQDMAYYLRRAAQEDEAAASASCAEARACHEELAALYRERCGLALNPLIPRDGAPRKALPAPPIQLGIAA